MTWGDCFTVFQAFFLLKMGLLRRRHSGHPSAWLCFVLSAMLFGVSGFGIHVHWQVEHLARPLAEYSIIHMPETGKCPAGFRKIAGLFEQHKKLIDGCLNEADQEPGHFLVDYLRGGESLHVWMILESEPAAPKQQT